MDSVVQMPEKSRRIDRRFWMVAPCLCANDPVAWEHIVAPETLVWLPPFGKHPPGHDTSTHSTQRVKTEEYLMATVDVLIPTCRRKTGLAVVLTSLLGQTFTDFVVIISDQTDDDQTYLECREIDTLIR